MQRRLEEANQIEAIHQKNNLEKQIAAQEKMELSRRVAELS